MALFKLQQWLSKLSKLLRLAVFHRRGYTIVLIIGVAICMSEIYYAPLQHNGVHVRMKRTTNCHDTAAVQTSFTTLFKRNILLSTQTCFLTKLISEWLVKSMSLETMYYLVGIYKMGQNDQAVADKQFCVCGVGRLGR